MTERTKRLGAIIGPGRSGTTWAGTLIDSCAEVIYRFEPFHRMSKIDTDAARWFQMLKDQEVTESDLPRIYDLLCPANPLTNKAPFFADKSYRIATVGKRQLWPAARVLPAARWMYSRIYSPTPGPPIVFKEVTFIKPLKNLLERTSMPIVYVVRHPCATVHSMIRGPDDGTMSSRHERMERVLSGQSPELLEEFAAVVRGSDAVSRTALLWRCEVETCVSIARKSQNALVLTYEQLATEPVVHTRRMFDHLGLNFGNSTKQFIESLTQIADTSVKNVRRTGWGAKYYSVLRNPATQKDAWQRSMSATERLKVEEIVQGSPAIEYCASLGSWW